MITYWLLEYHKNCSLCRSIKEFFLLLTYRKSTFKIVPRLSFLDFTICLRSLFFDSINQSHTTTNFEIGSRRKLIPTFNFYTSWNGRTWSDPNTVVVRQWIKKSVSITDNSLNRSRTYYISALPITIVTKERPWKIIQIQRTVSN